MGSNHGTIGVMHRTLLILLISLCFLSGVPVIGQDDAVDVRLDRLEPLTGTLDATNPRDLYAFNGTRGEVIRIQLQTVNGTLDPVLSVFDSAGQVILNRDDYRGQRGVDVELTLDYDDRYSVAVGRFGYALGSTAGDYELTLNRVGINSVQGSTLVVGVPVTNAITNTQSEVYYTFRANRGDILNIDMVRSSGTLDPYLQVVDSERFLIADNDDAAGGVSRNSRIENLLIEESGTYIIIASRYGLAGGESVGSFVLTITEADDSGLGNSQQAPQPLLYDQTVANNITNDQPQRYYQFDALRDEIITVTMDQRDGRLDAYLIVATDTFQPLIENDDGGAGRNARIDEYRIPADGTYVIIATRYDGEDGGGSVGGYELTLRSNGSAFAGVAPAIPRLLYGTTVQDVISDDDQDSLFVFWGQAGDIVTLSMNRSDGNIDGVVELLDANQVRIAVDDDSGGGGNARLTFELNYTGVHYVRTTRYDGTAKPTGTTGGYNLILSGTTPQ